MSLLRKPGIEDVRLQRDLLRARKSERSAV